MKSGRQKAILELIRLYEIDTQEELVKRLKEKGFEVTQATISRDIKQLHLIKVPASTGKQKYAVSAMEDQTTANKYMRVLADGIISVESAGNILVIKTGSGLAMAVAAAVDSLKLEGVLGSIAGDDTVMCVVKEHSQISQVVRQLNHLSNRG
ncbi:MAG: arginine repressor [Eubacterium sp.]|nr:arginine repressor [Eubacterium sp.]